MGLCHECTGAHPTIKREDLRPNPHKCEKVERAETVQATATAIIKTKPHQDTQIKCGIVPILVIELCALGIIGAVIGVPILAQHIKWSRDMWVNLFWFSTCIATAIGLLALVVTLIGAMIKKLRDFSS